MIKKDKGIITSIQGKKAIAMTKSGEFIRVSLPQGADIGSEVEFSRKPSLSSLIEDIILKIQTTLASATKITRKTKIF